jgi:hypothetical protein
MFICGEVKPEFDQWAIHSGFADFYGSMIKFPFFGSKYNVIAPLLILFFAIIFGVLGTFKYNSKTVEGLIIY